ncbi:hypothetical protein M0Q97_02815 [Candidatus Dojkabacteria bacterium]|jgi:hypothetical protein|nr:hypothetical protein [Candidatus Dojkabacteria bacterium]
MEKELFKLVIYLLISIPVVHLFKFSMKESRISEDKFEKYTSSSIAILCALAIIFLIILFVKNFLNLF